MNTADPGGDIAFVLSRKDLAIECEQNPGNERCFLGHENLYGRFTVEVDGQWGPYQFCNPDNTRHGPDTSHFDCCAVFDHDSPGQCPPKGPAAAVSGFSPYPAGCNCARGNVSVGKIDHGEMERWAGWADHSPYSQVLGGLWFSTPRRGKCPPGQAPGTGQRGECTWRVADAVYKNTSCVDRKLDEAVEAHGASCFKRCPPRSDPGYYGCYLQCYFDAVNGNATAAGGPLAAMTKPQLTAPWVDAIERDEPGQGGCPRCRGAPPFRLGSCPV